jgi:hypothetical protein
MIESLGRSLCALLLLAIGLGCDPTPLWAQDNQFLIDANTVEAWIFQRQGNREAAENALRNSMRIKLAALDEQFELTPEQIDQLQLAASGDFKRFFDAADSAVRNLSGRRVGRNRFQIAWQVTSPLRQKLQDGLLEEDSLFHKALLDVLDPAQAEALRVERAERRRRALEAATRSFIARGSIYWPVTPDQMERLTELIMERLTRLRRTDKYSYYLVGYAVSQIPKAELKALLDDQQMRFIEFQIRQYKRMEPTLRAQGLLEEVNDE